MRVIVPIITCLLLFPFLFSCTDPVKKERKTLLPADSIIPEPVMVQLLADMHMLEAGLTGKRTQGEKVSEYAAECYRELFRKYGVTETGFRENLKYYQWDTGEYRDLYDKVVAELKSRKSWITAPPAGKLGPW